MAKTSAADFPKSHRSSAQAIVPFAQSLLSAESQRNRLRLMIPTVQTNRYVMLMLTTAALDLLIACSDGFAWVQPLPESQPDTHHLSCSSGYDRQECEEHLAKLKTVLVQYPIDRLKGWDWIVVSSEEWQPLLRRLHLNSRSIAFSSVEQHTVVFEEAIFLRGERTEKLAHNLRVPIDQLISMAVSHELGHILCHDGNEEAADRVAEQLRKGKHYECGGDMKSLTSMQELMYQQSRILGGPFRR